MGLPHPECPDASIHVRDGWGHGGRVAFILASAMAAGSLGGLAIGRANWHAAAVVSRGPGDAATAGPRTKMEKIPREADDGGDWRKFRGMQIGEEWRKGGNFTNF